MLSSACLTNQDTMPGLAPQQETAVDPPGLRARVEDASRAGVVGARRRAGALVEVEAGPRLGDRVDVERTELAAELHDVARGGVDREVDAEALPAAFGEKRRQELAVIVVRHAPSG